MKAFNGFTEEQQKERQNELEDFDDEDESEFDYDVCYECAGYGDDYHYDPDIDDFVCNCDDCPYNPVNQDDFD